VLNFNLCVIINIFFGGEEFNFYGVAAKELKIVMHEKINRKKIEI